jgi:hypothetical protein
MSSVSCVSAMGWSEMEPGKGALYNIDWMLECVASICIEQHQSEKNNRENRGNGSDMVPTRPVF